MEVEGYVFCAQTQELFWTSTMAAFWLYSCFKSILGVNESSVCLIPN
jgi:hypothetical protein